MSERTGVEGPLAEFQGLRQELDSRANRQHQIMVLQLTTAATIFGFVLSRDHLVGLLLVLPISSFLLCGRFVDQGRSIQRISRYVTEELSPRIPGGLHWDSWLAKEWSARTTADRATGWIIPVLLTYPGAGLLALIWTASFVFAREGASPQARFGLSLIWIGGAACVLLAAYLVVRVVLAANRAATTMNVPPSDGSVPTDASSPPATIGSVPPPRL